MGGWCVSRLWVQPIPAVWALSLAFNSTTHFQKEEMGPLRLCGENSINVRSDLTNSSVISDVYIFRIPLMPKNSNGYLLCWLMSRKMNQH